MKPPFSILTNRELPGDFSSRNPPEAHPYPNRSHDLDAMKTELPLLAESSVPHHGSSKDRLASLHVRKDVTLSNARFSVFVENLFESL